MDLSIVSILLLDGLTNGAVYALLGLATVLVFTVTRVIFIPQGEFVAYGALTLAMIGNNVFPATAWLLLGAGVAFAVSVALRSPFQFEVIKDRAALARVVDDGVVENVYRIRVMNRTESPQHYRVAVGGIDGLQLDAPELAVPPAAIETLVARVKLAPEAAQPLRGQTTPIEFQVRALQDSPGGGAVLRDKSTFHVPR